VKTEGVHGRFSRAVLAAVVAVCVGAAGVLLMTGAAGSESAASVPPDLQVLIKRSQNLRVPFLIAHVRVRFDIHGPPHTIATFARQSRGSPQESRTVTAAIGDTFEARYLKGKLYRRVPQRVVSVVPGLRRSLDGRSWIRLGRGGLPAARGFSVPVPINPAAPNPVVPIGLAGLVALMSSMHEVGPTTIDGQAVTEFTGTVSPARKITAVDKEFSVLEGSSSVAVILDIAPDGLLTRVVLGTAGKGETFDLTGEVPSITTPVTIHPPSSRKTIVAGILTDAQTKSLKRIFHTIDLL
jgi:hypothetical protein